MYYIILEHNRTLSSTNLSLSMLAWSMSCCVLSCVHVGMSMSLTDLIRRTEGSSGPLAPMPGSHPPRARRDPSRFARRARVGNAAPDPFPARLSRLLRSRSAIEAGVRAERAAIGRAPTLPRRTPRKHATPFLLACLFVLSLLT